MYDSVLARPDRNKASVEYKAALAIPGIQPDVQAAAEEGLKQAFTVPKRAASQPEKDEDEDLDPTGAKQKESYALGEQKKPQ